jgi:hypothetical protein
MHAGFKRSARVPLATVWDVGTAARDPSDLGVGVFLALRARDRELCDFARAILAVG